MTETWFIEGLRDGIIIIVGVTLLIPLAVVWAKYVMVPIVDWLDENL